MLDETLECLSRIGIETPSAEELDRQLVFYDHEERFKFVVVKPYDVTTYVEYGAADVGVSGKDIIEETEANIYEPVDLGFSRCRLSVARPEDGIAGSERETPRVATEFTNISERYFARKGQNVEIIKLHGSVELAPLIGLSHMIVDIVSTGQTLRQNNLVEEEVILESSARLIVNRPSMKIHREPIKQLIRELEQSVGLTD